MADLRFVIKIFDFMFVSIWGLTLVDIASLVTKNESILNIDDSLKTFMAVVGAIYFIVQIPHRIRTQRIEREIKKQELEKLKKENETSN